MSNILWGKWMKHLSSLIWKNINLISILPQKKPLNVKSVLPIGIVLAFVPWKELSFLMSNYKLSVSL